MTLRMEKENCHADGLLLSDDAGLGEFGGGASSGMGAAAAARTGAGD